MKRFLLREGVVELRLLHHDGLADEVDDGHPLPVLLYAAADVALLADGPDLLEAIQEVHAHRLRVHPLGVHAQLVRADDAHLRHGVQDVQHLFCIV